jgi:SAM-dependent methyltransferase
VDGCAAASRRAAPAREQALSGLEGDTRLQSAVLEDLAEAVNYRRWLVDLALPYLTGPTLEIGSGLGHYAADWADRGVPITASEADPDRLAALRQRFADGRVAVREIAMPMEVGAGYAAVVAMNVLEHIPDDVAALRGFAGLLRPAGRVVLLVPALPALMSEFDRAIGHQRRYRRRGLAATLQQAGLAVDVLHYLNLPGVLAWYVGMRLLRMTPRSGPVLSTWDRFVVPTARRVECRWRPPVGQSLFAVASRPA